MRWRRSIVAAATAVLLAPSAGAEVRLATPDALVIEHRFAISASPEVAWSVLVHPERYWPKEHTWSGNPANLSLVPHAEGCFCERWTDASVEHARVIMALPGRLLRLRGWLGPFQDIAVTGVLMRAYSLNETTGAWETQGLAIDRGFWPMQEPQKMDDGHWIMAGARVSHGYDVVGDLPAVAISRGEAFTRWDLVVIPPAPRLGDLG